MTVDFAWHLSRYMASLHGSEESFWKSMNPARMYYLLKALEPKPKEEPKQSIEDILRGV